MQRDAFRHRIRALAQDGWDTVPRDRLVNGWNRYYWVVAGVTIAGGVLAMGRPFLRRHGTGPPLPHTDTIILEYVGWYVAQGHTLYTDIWEIKPPLAFVPSYLFAHLTGTNMYLHHVLGIATTTVAFAATAAFAARTVGTLTDSPEAGFATALVLFALPDLFYLPWMGYKAKLLAFALGMAALDRAVRERYFSSGVLAGLTVGIWQLALLFPVVTTIYAVHTRSLDEIRRHVAGGVVAIAVILGTLLLYADLGGFVAEVILGPLALQTERGGFDIGTYLRYFPGDAARWLGLIGVIGMGVTLLDSERASARPLALGGVFVFGILLVDFDGLSDMIYPLVFTALGVGLAVSYLPRRVGLASIVLLALVVTPTFAPSGLINPEPVELEPSDGLPPALGPEREHVYWTNQSIQSCRFFGAGTQRSILDYYPEDTTLADVPCGNLSLYWEVTRHRLFGAAPPQLNATPVTPSPARIVTDGAIDYHVENDATIVTVPVTNRDDERHTARAVADVEINGTSFERCRALSLDGGERTTLRFRFDDVSATPGGVSVQVRFNSSDNSTTPCE